MWSHLFIIGVIKEEARTRCGGDAYLEEALMSGRVKKRMGKSGYEMYYFLCEESGRHDTYSIGEQMSADRACSKAALKATRDYMEKLDWNPLAEAIIL